MQVTEAVRFVMMWRSMRAAAATLILGAASSSLRADWTVVHLHPEGAAYSIARGVHGGQQVGEVDINGTSQASLWTGSAESWVSLHPAGATGSSHAYGVRDGVQCGDARVNEAGNMSTASVWTGSAASWVPLDDPDFPGRFGFAQFTAYATDQGVHIGSATPFSGPYHAGIWIGDEGGWIDLNPGLGDARALGGDSTQQVGWAADFGATLWEGTPESAVSLHPPGATNSQALAADGGVQVGWAVIAGKYNALKWTGTAASVVNLHPAGFDGSQALALFGEWQAGMAWEDNVAHASIWHGSASTWVDLHECLPDEYFLSMAHGIWTDGDLIYVVGEAHSPGAPTTEAILWIGTGKCGCSADITGDQQVNGADLGILLGAWGGVFPDADLNVDGAVDGADLGLLLGSWGICP